MAIRGKQVQEWLKPAAIILGGYLLWRYAAKPVLETLGLKESSEDKTRQKVETAPANKDYWRPSWFRLPPSQLPVPGATGLVLLNGTLVKNYTTMLLTAMAGAGTNEERIYGIFRALKYKSQVSFLAYTYYERFKSDLYQDLRYELTDSEMNTGLQITEKLPWGIVTKNGTK